ncbi:MAG: hypothetical protein C4297_14175 [Gemmataceae bacterium]
MSVAVEYTLSEMVLLAAYQLEQQGQTPFSAEDLVVQCWRQFPRAFGLKGYTEQYPDSNRVLASIMGERGLARKGWLIKKGQKLYEISREGKHMVERILSGADEHESLAGVVEEPPALSREQARLLLHLLDSAAAEKFNANRRQELVFADACRFWNLTPQLGADAVNQRLQRVEKLLAEAESLAGEGCLHLDDREVAAADLRMLRELHRFLQEKFSRHLALLRSRR